MQTPEKASPPATENSKSTVNCLDVPRPRSISNTSTGSMGDSKLQSEERHLPSSLRLNAREKRHISNHFASHGTANVMVMIIHGAGPPGPGMERDNKHLLALRSHTKELLADIFDDMDRPKIDFETCDWHMQLHATYPEIHSTLHNVKPQGLGGVRDFLNVHLPDVLMFVEHAKRDIILSICQKRLNNIYAKWFKDLKSKRNAHVFIIGHCLGALIAYDLLSRTDFPLEFAVTGCFALGTPFGWFLANEGHSTGTLPHVFPRLPGSRYFYNIIHPYDPLATRFEPFVKEALATSDPIQLPYWKTGGSIMMSRSSTAAAGAAGFVAGLVVMPIVAPVLALLGGVVAYRNGTVVERLSAKMSKPLKKPREWLGGRFDFQVQTEIPEDISSHTSMLMAHHIYWTNKDVLYFMLTQIFRNVHLQTSVGKVPEPNGDNSTATKSRRTELSVQARENGMACLGVIGRFGTYCWAMQYIGKPQKWSYTGIFCRAAVCYTIWCLFLSLCLSNHPEDEGLVSMGVSV